MRNNEQKLIKEQFLLENWIKMLDKTVNIGWEKSRTDAKKTAGNSKIMNWGKKLTHCNNRLKIKKVIPLSCMVQKALTKVLLPNVLFNEPPFVLQH